MSKRSGSVFVTFRVKSDGSIPLDDLKDQLNNIANQDIGYPVMSVGSEKEDKKRKTGIEKIEENPVLEAGGDGMSSVRMSVAAPSMKTPMGSNPLNNTDGSMAISKVIKSKTDDDDDLFGGAEIKSSVDMDRDEIMAKIDDLQKQINQIKKDGVAVGKSTDKIKMVNYGKGSEASTPVASIIKSKSKKS